MKSLLKICLVAVLLIGCITLCSCFSEDTPDIHPGDTDNGGDAGDTDEPDTPGDSTTPDDPYTEGLVFCLNGEGDAYMVEDYTGEATEVIIPARYQGKEVTEIIGHIFYNSPHVTSVFIPKTINRIVPSAVPVNDSLEVRIDPANEHYCFEDHMLYSKDKTVLYAVLKDVGESFIVPETVKVIENGVFVGRESLCTVVLPEGLVEIGHSAFSGCTSLSEINLPDSLKVINGVAFYECDGLDGIDLPDNLETIGPMAFYGCHFSQEVVIPASVCALGSDTFDGSFYKVTVAKDSPYYYSDGRLIIHKPSMMLTAVWGEYTDTELVVPYGVTRISSGISRSTRQVNTLVLHDTVTTVTSFGNFSIPLTKIVYVGSEDDWKKIEGVDKLVSNYPDCTVVFMDPTEYELQSAAARCEKLQQMLPEWEKRLEDIGKLITSFEKYLRDYQKNLTNIEKYKAEGNEAKVKQEEAKFKANRKLCNTTFVRIRREIELLWALEDSFLAYDHTLRAIDLLEENVGAGESGAAYEQAISQLRQSAEQQLTLLREMDADIQAVYEKAIGIYQPLSEGAEQAQAQFESKYQSYREYVDHYIK